MAELFFYDNDIFCTSAVFDGSPGKKHLFMRDQSDLHVLWGLNWRLWVILFAFLRVFAFDISFKSNLEKNSIESTQC